MTRVTSSKAREAKEATKAYEKDHLLKIYNLINEVPLASARQFN